MLLMYPTTALPAQYFCLKTIVSEQVSPLKSQGSNPGLYGIQTSRNPTIYWILVLDEDIYSLKDDHTIGRPGTNDPKSETST